MISHVYSLQKLIPKNHFKVILSICLGIIKISIFEFYKDKLTLNFYIIFLNGDGFFKFNSKITKSNELNFCLHLTEINGKLFLANHF